MALSASSTYTQTLTHRLTSASADLSPIPQGLAPLPAKPKFNGSELRRTTSRTPIHASAREAVNTDLQSTISKVGEDIATASEDILDAVDSVIEDGPRRNRKRNSRTSRRRALIMCLALGMVRPCASNAVNGMRDGMRDGVKEGGNELRRTVSEFPPTIARTSSMQVPVSGLMSQVSLATSLKQVNLLGQHEDLQKLTTLQ